MRCRKKDLAVGFGAAASAVDDAAVDLRNRVAGEGEAGGGHGLLEREVEGPATALADGVRRGRRERLPRGPAAAAASVLVAAAAAPRFVLAAERREVPPPLASASNGFHLSAAAAAGGRGVLRRAAVWGSFGEIRSMRRVFTPPIRFCGSESSSLVSLQMGPGQRKQREMFLGAEEDELSEAVLSVQAQRTGVVDWSSCWW